MARSLTMANPETLPSLPSFLGAAIPALQSIEEPLPPTPWEQHGASTLLAISLGIALAAIAIRWFRSPRSKALPSPADQAREALDPIATGPGTQASAGIVLQTVRHYLPATIPGLPRGELTASELINALQTRAGLNPDLIGQIRTLLQDSEALHFSCSAAGSASQLATRALHLIDQVESAQTATSEASTPAK